MRVLLGKDIPLSNGVLHVCIQFQPKDGWVGIYTESLRPYRGYICLLPFFPVHITYVPKPDLIVIVDFARRRKTVKEQNEALRSLAREMADFIEDHTPIDFDVFEGKLNAFAERARQLLGEEQA